MNKAGAMKYLFICAAALSSWNSLHGCPDPCEARNAASFNMKETISAYVGPTDRSERNVSLLTMMASDDLENYLTGRNVTFLYPSSEISETMSVREDGLFGMMLHEWPSGKESVTTKGKKFSLKVGGSDGGVKTLTLRIENAQTGTLLKKYELTGGYKQKEGDVGFVNKSDTRDGYVYHIDVEAETFKAGGSKRESMKLWQKYNSDGIARSLAGWNSPMKTQLLLRRYANL